jgi:hypothetical protein
MSLQLAVNSLRFAVGRSTNAGRRSVWGYGTLWDDDTDGTNGTHGTYGSGPTANRQPLTANR